MGSIRVDSAPDKVQLLANYVTPSVFSHISDCKTYDEAITMLKTVYVKPTNVIFARHLLATRKQTTSEAVDQFLHALKLLSKDCEFRAVSADTYTQEAIYLRDAFLYGTSSPMIRQRLLEKERLSLPEAVQLARSWIPLSATQKCIWLQHPPVTSLQPQQMSLELPLRRPLDSKLELRIWMTTLGELRMFPILQQLRLPN